MRLSAMYSIRPSYQLEYYQIQMKSGVIVLHRPCLMICSIILGVLRQPAPKVYLASL